MQNPSQQHTGKCLMTLFDVICPGKCSNKLKQRKITLKAILYESSELVCGLELHISITEEILCVSRFHYLILPSQFSVFCFEAIHFLHGPICAVYPAMLNSNCLKAYSNASISLTSCQRERIYTTNYRLQSKSLWVIFLIFGAHLHLSWISWC